MSRFDEIEQNSKNPAATAPFKEIDMYLDCTTCNEEVQTVKYYPNENALIFDCSKGHRSIVENIGIAF